MIGELQAALCLGEIFLREEFRHVLRLGTDGMGFLRIGRIEPQHVAIVLDGGAAARGRDDHGIDICLRPLVDRAPCAGQCIILLAHVMGERSAAGLLARDHDLIAKPRQQAERRRVDAGIEHALHAAHQQRHAALRGPRAG